MDCYFSIFVYSTPPISVKPFLKERLLGSKTLLSKSFGFCRRCRRWAQLSLSLFRNVVRGNISWRFYVNIFVLSCKAKISWEAKYARQMLNKTIMWYVMLYFNILVSNWKEKLKTITSLLNIYHNITANVIYIRIENKNCYKVAFLYMYETFAFFHSYSK